MRFDRAKSFPHPVLRAGSSDYEEVEFQVTLELERTVQTTAVELEAVFDLSDPDLRDLVRQEQAEYALLVVCRQTRRRRELRSGARQLRHRFANGELGGEVELRPFLLATMDIPGFQARHWNQDYRGRTFNIKNGAVLAADAPHQSWIDVIDEGPIGSIFRVATSPDIEEGWAVRLEEDRIQIGMSKQNYDCLAKARAAAKSAEDWAYLMNGLYLPALIHVLAEADRLHADDILADRRWYSSLQSRLEQIGAPSLGSVTDDGRARDAQRLLANPFANLLSRLHRETEG